MNLPRLALTITSLAVTFLTSCATQPVYQGALPKMPKKWPSEESRSDGLGSKGWPEIQRIWSRALTQSPAPSKVARQLHWQVWNRQSPFATFRWLAPDTAIASFNDDPLVGFTDYKIVFQRKQDHWRPMHSYSRGTDGIIEWYYPYPQPREFCGPSLMIVHGL
jgi:hypothetical protein